MIAQVKVNLGCGEVYIAGNGWVNIDYSAVGPHILRANLLGRLPLPDNAAALVYSSHFLEHIPRDKVHEFLAECLRILSPGGVLRLVLPDLENLSRSYLEHREVGQHEKADLVVLEMIDQCVRRDSGGELGRKYRQLCSDPQTHCDLIDFVRERTGESLTPLAPARRSTTSDRILRLSGRARSCVERLWIHAVLKLLPVAFRTQNISLANVGELHQWLWDFHQLRQELQAAGFIAIQRCESSISRVVGFPFMPLDLDVEGRPRKGKESMYVEAQKPAL